MTEQYVQYQGFPFRVSDPGQLADMARAGGVGIPQAQAQEQAGALGDIATAQEQLGTGGQALLGGISGMTLGLGPGLLVKAGLLDPHLAGAAQTSGAYTAGDVAGTIIPSLFTGGEAGAVRGVLGKAMAATPMGIAGRLGGGAERLAARLIPESAGLMGRAASVPLKMAARGATEGALINMGHYVGDSLIQNKPLAAEAVVASGIDGALFGGLAGGALGTVGAIGKLATEALGKGAGQLGSRGAEGIVARRLGMTEDMVGNVTKEHGSLGDYIRKARGVLTEAEPSLTYGSRSADIAGGYGRAGELAGSVRKGVIETLDKEAGSEASLIGERLKGRLQGEVLDKYSGTLLQKQAGKEVQKVLDELGLAERPEKLGGPPRKPIDLSPPPEPKKLNNKEYAYREGGQWKTGSIQEANAAYEAEVSAWKQKIANQAPEVATPTPDSWSKWLQARDQLAERATGSGPKAAVAKEILAVVDDSIRKGMEAAEEKIGQKGLADKFAAATASGKIAKEMEAVTGKKAASELLAHETTFTPRDIGVMGSMAALGHPGTALGWMAAKGLARHLDRRLSPAMAEMAYQSGIGQKAAGAEVIAKARIREAVQNFFRASGKSASALYAEKGQKQSYDRKAYEEAASRTEQLVSQNHRNQVQQAVETLLQNGYGQYATAVNDVYNRAAEYMAFNMPKRKGTIGLGSLRPQPKVHGLDMKEFKFLRQDRAVKNPFTLLDDMHKGSVSRDSVQAVKYVYPELHSQIVQESVQQIYEMKQEGKYLPMDKIATLGIVLDSPVDSTLTPEFIGEVQTALAQAGQPPPTSQPEQQAPTPIPGSPISPDSQNLLPPSDLALV